MTQPIFEPGTCQVPIQVVTVNIETPSATFMRRTNCSVVLRPIFRPLSPRCWGCEIFEFLRHGDLGPRPPPPVEGLAIFVFRAPLSKPVPHGYTSQLVIMLFQHGLVRNKTFLRSSFIQYSVQNLFQNSSSTQCDLELPLSNESVLSCP
jgi:hypothetical protein